MTDLSSDSPSPSALPSADRAHGRDAEHALVAALVLGHAEPADLSGRLAGRDFFDPAAGLIFDTILTAARAGRGADAAGRFTQLPSMLRAARELRSDGYPIRPLLGWLPTVSVPAHPQAWAALVVASALGRQQMTSAVLRCYLHAAALSGRPIGDLLAWAARPEDPTPVRILRNTPGACGGWAEELASQAGADPKQRDTVWSGVRRAVDSLADPRVVAACSPPEGAGFDPTRFLTEGATLYLLGATGVQLSVAPLITALLEDVLDTARERAAHSPQGRLDPPVLLLLDEAANIAPIPSLPNLLADGGGVGITTVAVLQSLAQARNRWSESAADSMVDAATIKVVLGGLAHATDLANISRLAGEVDVPLHTRSSGSTGSSHSTTTQRLPVLPIDKIRTLPARRALVLARRCAPVEVQLQPYWKHPQYRATSRNDPSLGVLRRTARRMFRAAAALGTATEPTTNETPPSQNATTEGIEPCS